MNKMDLQEKINRVLIELELARTKMRNNEPLSEYEKSLLVTSMINTRKMKKIRGEF